VRAGIILFAVLLPPGGMDTIIAGVTVVRNSKTAL
jgi:hypothetical protein